MPEVSYADVQGALSDQAVPSGVPSSLSVADSQKLGDSNLIQYTEPKPAPNLGERVSEDLTKPFVQTQHTIGALTSWLGSNVRDETPFGALGDRINRAGIVLQERTSANLAKNYSNFTPNLLDDIVGAVPTIASYLGVGAAATAMGAPAATVGAVGTAALATAGGLGIASEEFNKFKMQGKSTPEADKLATMIGVPVGGVMAAGFGVVGKLVEPWFKNMLGATISKIAGDAIANGASKTAGVAAAGAAGFGAQAAVQDTGEFATGAEPFKGTESVVKGLTDTAHNAIMGGVLGGALGMHFAFAQHAQFEAGLKQLGLDDAQAKQTANDVLGQGSHTLMDAVEKHLNYTSDENARIQAPPAQGEVRPNILVKGGIPNDLNFPPVEQLPKDDTEVAPLTKDFKYVKVEPLDLNFKATMGDTAEDIRYKFLGNKNQQIAGIVHLNQDIKKMASSDLERHAMFMNDKSIEFYQLAQRDPEKAAMQLHMELRDLHGDTIDPNVKEVVETAAKIRSMLPIIDQILNPTEGMITATKEGDRYYEEQGIVSKAFGTIDEARAHFQSSRLYKSEPLSDKVKLDSTNRIFSAHKLQRYYPDKWLALADGKEFKTMDYADSLLDHGIEHTEVNHSRQMMDAMSGLKPQPLGQWVRRVPSDWQQIGTTNKLMHERDPKTGDLRLDESGNPKAYTMVFAAPKGIANGLKPITDPNYFKNVSKYKELADFQNAIKTGMVSFSLFHHETIASQILSSYDGYKTLAELSKALKDDVMSEPAFRALEKDFLGSGGDTTILHENQDIVKLMDMKDSVMSKVVQAPFIKDISKLADMNTKLLFHGMQRYAKVMTYSRNMAKWEGEHPNATLDETETAKRDYARSTNAQYGGLNWQALGVERSHLAFMRMVLLAPDWVVSNLLKMKYATEPTAAGSQSRWSLASGLLGGILVNNLLNQMFTGHSSLENKKGHQWETEVAPDVYNNTVRGGPGELLKVMSDVIESQGAEGFARYAGGKFSPILSAGTTFFSGVNYAGQNIWKGENAVQKNVSGFWNVVSHLLPIPFAANTAFSYASREDNQSPAGWAALASGLGRFSKPSESLEKGDLNHKVIQAYRSGNDEYVEHLVSKGDLSEDQAAKLKEDSSLSDAELKVRHMKIDKAFQFYSQSSEADQKDIRDLIEDKYQRFQDSDASPNQKKKMEKLYQQFSK